MLPGRLLGEESTLLREVSKETESVSAWEETDSYKGRAKASVSCTFSTAERVIIPSTILQSTIL